MSPTPPRAHRLLFLGLTGLLLAGCPDRSAPEAAPPSEDQAALEELRRAGVDVSQPQKVVHHVLFATTEGAERVAKAAHLKGFEINLVHEPRLREGKPYLLIVRKPLVPTLENLRAVRVELTELAAPEGGEYDGWQVHLR